MPLDDDEGEALILDTDENGEPVPFETPQDAMRALVAMFGEIHPDQVIEIHNAECDNHPDCDCPRLTAAELLPKAQA